MNNPPYKLSMTWGKPVGRNATGGALAPFPARVPAMSR
jgi:hypothetical protein